MNVVKLMPLGYIDSPSQNIYFTYLIWVIPYWFNDTILDKHALVLPVTTISSLGERGMIDRFRGLVMQTSVKDRLNMGKITNIICCIMITIHVHTTSHPRLMVNNKACYNSKSRQEGLNGRS